ncbi:hypothetical protein ASG41_07595 [Modestobacter sp. Leaf380]|nr:hypothetical protein ASG41_07595 [Modestobacter sp. Leaf380]
MGGDAEESVTQVLASWAVRVEKKADRWEVELLAQDASDELPVLERALGAPGTSWPGPYVLVVDTRLYFVALTHGPGGMVRALISDVTLQEWLLASELVERYGIDPGDLDAADEAEDGWPAGDLDLFGDAGLPADELAPILAADLWADEMVAAVAARLGFADELAAAVRP